MLDKLRVPDQLGWEGHHFWAQVSWGRIGEGPKELACAIEAWKKEYAGHVQWEKAGRRPNA